MFYIFLFCMTLCFGTEQKKDDITPVLMGVYSFAQALGNPNFPCINLYWSDENCPPKKAYLAYRNPRQEKAFILEIKPEYAVNIDAILSPDQSVMYWLARNQQNPRSPILVSIQLGKEKLSLARADTLSLDQSNGKEYEIFFVGSTLCLCSFTSRTRKHNLDIYTVNLFADGKNKVTHLISAGQENYNPQMLAEKTLITVTE